MIELGRDSLEVSFPQVHPQARLRITLQRTLRIPDDGRHYPLPLGLGAFPMRHVDDFASHVPESWVRHGGVMLPMHQSEAMWVQLVTTWISGPDWEQAPYRFAVKIAAGKINAVSGEPWLAWLNRGPQDYVVCPDQPWLDGFCVAQGVIRQFVAMPLGDGYTVEEQLTASAQHGGIQIAVYPMKRQAYERRFPKVRKNTDVLSPAEEGLREGQCLAKPAMGLGAGGRMRQKIYPDRYKLEDWDQRHVSRCFVHVCNSLTWRSITGHAPPTLPPTAAAYTLAGLPWFDYYDGDAKALAGSRRLAGVCSVQQMGDQKGDSPLPENESVEPSHVVAIRPPLQGGVVRECGD